MNTLGKLGLAMVFAMMAACSGAAPATPKEQPLDSAIGGGTTEQTSSGTVALRLASGQEPVALSDILPRVLHIVNGGTSTVKITEILAPSGVRVASWCLQTLLAPEASCSMAITMAPETTPGSMPEKGVLTIALESSSGAQWIPTTTTLELNFQRSTDPTAAPPSEAR